MASIADWSHETVLGPEPMSSALARDFVCLHLVAHHLAHLVEDMRLVVSELAANAVAHAQTPFSVTLSSANGLVLLAIQDGSAAAPVRSASDVMDVSGRGLMIVEVLSHKWGTSTDGHGASERGCRSPSGPSEPANSAHRHGGWIREPAVCLGHALGAVLHRAAEECRQARVSPRLVRRAFMRSCVTRAIPAMATSTPPPTAAINRAIPSGIVPLKPRKWTSTFVEFCSTKTMSRIRSRSAAPVATQTALARVRRGGSGAGGETSPKDGVSVGPSSDGADREGFVDMVPTFLASRFP